jgi:prepilin-type N-terminal cleavage/methylation domain-containing protein
MIKKGFTLLEVVIVVGIISVLSLIAVNTINAFRQDAELDSTVNEFVTELKTARNKSMAGEIPESLTAADFGPDDSLPAYSVVVSGGTYCLARNYISGGVSHSEYQTTNYTWVTSCNDPSSIPSDLSLSFDGSVEFERITGNSTPANFEIKRNSDVGKTIKILPSGVITVSDL